TDIAAPFAAAEVRLHVAGEVLLGDFPFGAAVVTAGRSVVVRQPGGVVDDRLFERARREVPQVAREAAADRAREIARIERGRAILQIGPDIARRGAFGRARLPLVVRIARAEIDRGQRAEVDLLTEIQVDPVFFVDRGDLLIAPRAEARHARGRAIAADGPVERRARSVARPARAAAVVRRHFGDELTIGRAFTFS